MQTLLKLDLRIKGCVYMERTAVITRKTKETDIYTSLNLDGTGKSHVETGIGFLNHMLEGFARHGFFDLDMKIKGDLHVGRRYCAGNCHKRSTGR